MNHPSERESSEPALEAPQRRQSPVQRPAPARSKATIPRQPVRTRCRRERWPRRPSFQGIRDAASGDHRKRRRGGSISREALNGWGYRNDVRLTCAALLAASL